jgi:hypothetical protein
MCPLRLLEYSAYWCVQGYVNCVCILAVTIAVAGAVSCPLQRGEVLFIVPLRAGGDDNWGPQLKGVTAVIIRITSLATGHLCIARESSVLQYISALLVIISLMPSYMCVCACVRAYIARFEVSTVVLPNILIFWFILGLLDHEDEYITLLRNICNCNKCTRLNSSQVCRHIEFIMYPPDCMLNFWNCRPDLDENGMELRIITAVGVPYCSGYRTVAKF